jgi:RNA polymerase sigma factor (sigma-70 family)
MLTSRRFAQRAMTDHRTDTQLIEACLAGDSAAWSSLVERYQRLVYSVALRQGLSAEDADDVFQTVFVILLGKLDTCRDRERLGSWLVTITRREAWRVLRERAAHAATAGDEQQMAAQPAAEPAPETTFQEMEEQDLIRQAMERLGSRCRRLLQYLFYTQERPSYAEIGRELGMPEGSIGPTRARCLEQLKSILAQLGFQ